MNAPQTASEQNALAPTSAPGFDLSGPLDATSLILGPAWQRITEAGDRMSRGAVTIPKHLRGNGADCSAIILQSLLWRLIPHAVAQKTYLDPGGRLGYEAQLISAILVSTGTIERQPDYEWFGDWTKVAGKVKEMQSDSGGKYYVATYTREDEEGLGVIVRATLRGEKEPRALRLLMSQCWPRFSTNWAMDPATQITYRAIAKWARINSPGAVLGVYFGDELEADTGNQPTERFMGAADVVGAPPPPPASPPPPPPPAQPQAYPAADFDRNLPQWEKLIRDGRKEPDAIIRMAETKGPMTPEQRAKLRAIKANPPAGTPAGSPPANGISQGPTQAPRPAAASPQIEDVAPKVTYATVADSLKRARAAESIQGLDDAATLIDAIADEAQRRELRRLYQDLRDEIAM